MTKKIEIPSFSEISEESKEIDYHFKKPNVRVDDVINKEIIVKDCFVHKGIFEKDDKASDLFEFLIVDNDGNEKALTTWSGVLKKQYDRIKDQDVKCDNDLIPFKTTIRKKGNYFHFA